VAADTPTIYSLDSASKNCTITLFTLKLCTKAMEVNPNLAAAILKKLSTFPYGIGEICANDVGVPHKIFVAQLTAMMCNKIGNNVQPLLSLADDDY